MPLDFRTAPQRGHTSAPPRYVLVPSQNIPQLPPLQPQLVLEDLNAMLENVIDNRDAPEIASNAVILVNAVVQTSRPPSAAASLNPFRGVNFVGTFSAFVDVRDIFPVFKADAAPHLPPPPPFISRLSCLNSPPTSAHALHTRFHIAPQNKECYPSRTARTSHKVHCGLCL